MRYNIFINNGIGIINFLALDEATLLKLINAYNNGEESIFFSGKKHLLGDIIEIQIYEFDNTGFKDGDDFFNLHINRNNIKSSLLGTYIPKHILESYGKKITDNYIVGEYGHLKKSRLDLANKNLKTTITNSQPTISEKKSGQVKSKSNRKVFIVHGHDELATQETARYLEKLGLEPIILREQPSNGNTIIEKIEENSDVSFGIVLYTGCDLGTVKTEPDNLRNRARQNVVFEHGFLIGKIGRKNVVALVKGDVEKPNDISGVVYIPMSDEWKLTLAKEIKSSGLEIDLNKAI